MAVEYRRQESVKAASTPADVPAAPVRTSLIQRISEFAPVRVADPMPPLPHDDLTRIRGIGPKLAERLNLLGVARFDQIAAWTAIDVRRLSMILGLGQIIAAQNWTGQAALLCGEASEKTPAPAEMTETRGVLNMAAPEADVVLPVVEPEEPPPAAAKTRHVTGGLLDALERAAALAPPAPRNFKREPEQEAQPERVTEQAAMPNSPETTSDIGVEESVDRPVVADSPPPLPQGPLQVAYWPTDELEDEEHGLRMIAALTMMPSLEPDCADLMMEEADITIIERAPMKFGEEDDAARGLEARVEGSLQARPHSDQEVLEINGVAHAGYYDDLGEATVEIFDVAEGDARDNASDPQERTPSRRKFFRALTGDGG